MRSDEWETPQALYDFLNKKFRFNLDAAATAKNTKCKEFYSKKKSFLTNTLTTSGWRVWCNCPYSMDREFAELCLQLYQDLNISSVLLLPVRSDRIWYNRIANTPGVRTIPFTGRIHFGNAKSGAFMYSVLFVIGFKNIVMPNWMDAGQFNKGFKGSAKS